jgi:hypothetical protein
MQGDGSSDLGDDDDFLGSFEPDDESTPLDLSKRKTLLAPSTVRSPSPLKVSSPNPRKGKLFAVEIQVPQPAAGIVVESSNASNVGDKNSISEDDLLPLAGGPDSEEFPEAWSETMASPISSSALSTPRADPASSKSRIALKNSGERVAQPRISTAILLENLLPRRRQQRRPPVDDARGFDIPDDCSVANQGTSARGFGSDEDELSYPLAKRTKNSSRKGLAEIKGGQNPKGKYQPRRDGGALSKRDRGKGKGNVSHGIATNKPSNLSAAAAKTIRLLKPKRDQITYSSRNLRGIEVNKENHPFGTSLSLPSHPDPDDPASDVAPIVKHGSGFISEELALLGKKFQAIDQWSMEFEDVTISASHSSPFR